MSSIWKRGDVWQYQSDDKVIRKSLHTDNEQVAKMLQNKLDRQAYYSENGLVDKEKTWKEFRDDYFVTYKATKAYRSFVKLQKVVKDFEEIVRPASLLGITKQKCELWQATRLSIVSPQTVVCEKSYLSPMLAYAHDSGFIERNPCKGMMSFDYVTPEPKVLTYDEAQAFLSALHAKYPHYDPLGRMAYDTGMRLDEILHQRPGDVDFGRHVLSVSAHKKTCPCIHCDRAEKKTGRRGWVPKTRVERLIPLSPALEKTLKGIVPAGGVFYPMGESTLGDVFGRIHVAAGIKGKARVHVFRHTMVTDLGRAGVRRGVIMAIVGHSPENSTDGYDHVAEWELQDAMKKLVEYRDAQGMKLKRSEVEGLKIVQAA